MILSGYISLKTKNTFYNHNNVSIHNVEKVKRNFKSKLNILKISFVFKDGEGAENIAVI